MMKLPTITLDELKHLIGDCVLIDVREPHELVYGMIPTAHNIPLGEVPEALSMSPEAFQQKYGFSLKGTLVFYCRTGGRSFRATQIAIEKGFNAKNYAGSIWEWSETDPNVKRYGPNPF